MWRQNITKYWLPETFNASRFQPFEKLDLSTKKGYVCIFYLLSAIAQDFFRRLHQPAG
jgi:hypothetical protein